MRKKRGVPNARKTRKRKPKPAPEPAYDPCLICGCKDFSEYTCCGCGAVPGQKPKQHKDRELTTEEYNRMWRKIGKDQQPRDFRRNADGALPARPPLPLPIEDITHAI